MFGFKKKDLPNPPSQDIESVKRRVLGNIEEESLENLIPQRHRENFSQPQMNRAPIVDESEGDQKDEMVPYAPVFVKLEKYGDLLTEISKTEALISHLKEAIAMRDKIDQIHASVINEIRETTALLENHLDTLDRKFRKPEAPKVDVVKPKQKTTQMDKIHEELENLKKELKELK